MRNKSLKYTTEKLNYKGKNIQTYSFGTGEKIIFSFPSFPHSGLYYILFSQYYDATKFRFITMDLPGWAGWSDNIFEGKGFGIEKYVDIAEFILSHYKIKKFSLIGYSFGGALALILASRRYKDINSLVIVSTIINGNLLNGDRHKNLLRLAKLLKQESRLRNHVLNTLRSMQPVAEVNFGKAYFAQYLSMFGQIDAHTIFDSLYQLFNNDYSKYMEQVRKIDRIMIVNSKNEPKMFRQQAEYLRRHLSHEKTYKMTGAHDDFILRPNSLTIKKVIDFLLK